MKDWAVLISDVHFNVKSLALAAAALRTAFQEARTRGVPLIIAGDLNDTKAIMRGECVNAILAIFAEFTDVETIVLVGNHDLINEKGKAHTLEFLRPYARVVDDVDFVHGLCLIPYQHDVEALREILSRPGVKSSTTIIMHQGIMGAHMGEYVVDKSSIPPEELANHRVITGHYHKAQDIKCGRPRKGSVGLASYIGTPYTVTFTEAHDGPKGIRVLKQDGLLEQIPLKLRKHVIEEVDLEGLDILIHTGAHPNPDDLFWLKVRGPASELDKLKKKDIGLRLIGHENFKFDKIYDQAEKLDAPANLPPDQLFDALIDASEETAPQKEFLKKLWREECA